MGATIDVQLFFFICNTYVFATLCERAVAVTVLCPRSISDRGSKVDVRRAWCSSCNLLRINQRSEESARLPRARIHLGISESHATVCYKSLYNFFLKNLSDSDLSDRPNSRLKLLRYFAYRYDRGFSAKFRNYREMFPRNVPTSFKNWQFIAVLCGVALQFTWLYREFWRSLTRWHSDRPALHFAARLAICVNRLTSMLNVRDITVTN